MTTLSLDDEAIFKIACRIPASAVREDYLQQVCAANQSLLVRVRRLLELHDQPDGFLEYAPEGGAATVDFPAFFELPGAQIGPYQLLDEIGMGGMGVVYLAQQQEPVSRQVAIKIIKPGMDTREVQARFAAEEQALALMDHPNIAKVYDAGVVEARDSRPATGKETADARRSDTALDPHLVSWGSPPEGSSLLPASRLSPGRAYFVMELVPAEQAHPS